MPTLTIVYLDTSPLAPQNGPNLERSGSSIHAAMHHKVVSKVNGHNDFDLVQALTAEAGAVPLVEVVENPGLVVLTGDVDLV